MCVAVVVAGGESEKELRGEEDRVAHRQGRAERYVYAGGGACYQSWLQLVVSDAVRQTVREGSKVPLQVRLVDDDKRIGRRKQDEPPK